MGLVTIDGNMLRKMIICGANELTRNSRSIDALNVFPVPDGDTGTNMSHTVQAAAREAAKLNTPNISDVAKAASNGSLRGARGNSGVILSQLFRGFARGLEGKSVANANDLADALAKSMETAYKAVMKPKEGTILTIARVIGEQAYECAYDEDDIETGLRAVIKHANDILNKTPAMLPELKQAGVVDAGGMGLLMIFKGALKGLTIRGDIEPESDIPPQADVLSPVGTSDVRIQFAYCTELLIDLDVSKAVPKKGNAASHGEMVETLLKNYLPAFGDSIVVVSDENIIKLHIHTNHPGLILEKALQYGYLSNIKIENMREQHTSLLQYATTVDPPKDIGFVAVAMGKGLSELFTGLGADAVIEGGQTMNPSADDILKSVASVNARHVIVLPNNKNIILAAQQAVELNNTQKEIHIVPTRSIPQGVACLVSYVDAVPVEDNLSEMKELIENVHTGQITHAVRDTVVNGIEIHAGDMLCLYDGDITLTGKELQQSAKDLAQHMLSHGGDVVSIYYGENVTAEMAQEIGDYIQENYPDKDVELYDGQQPVYFYILSVE